VSLVKGGRPNLPHGAEPHCEGAPERSKAGLRPRSRGNDAQVESPETNSRFPPLPTDLGIASRLPHSHRSDHDYIYARKKALPLIGASQDALRTAGPLTLSVRNDSGVQKLEAGAAVHLPLDHL
jgi:hypothetical protein